MAAFLSVHNESTVSRGIGIASHCSGFLPVRLLNIVEKYLERGPCALIAICCQKSDIYDWCFRCMENPLLLNLHFKYSISAWCHIVSTWPNMNKNEKKPFADNNMQKFMTNVDVLRFYCNINLGTCVCVHVYAWQCFCVSTVREQHIMLPLT